MNKILIASMIIATFSFSGYSKQRHEGRQDREYHEEQCKHDDREYHEERSRDLPPGIAKRGHRHHVERYYMEKPRYVETRHHTVFVKEESRPDVVIVKERVIEKPADPVFWPFPAPVPVPVPVPVPIPVPVRR
jgi:hypothetical protein